MTVKIGVFRVATEAILSPTYADFLSGLILICEIGGDKFLRKAELFPNSWRYDSDLLGYKAV